ncbi:hypothetical protein [Pseudonocardia sp. D17]|uniref:hypothetical protein n=1 Tax=Pseudonocardia sp. D17 TaxID=882661 RepID=UPI0030CB4DA8
MIVDRGPRSYPALCPDAPTHMGTRWYPHTRAGYRVAVCSAHLDTVDDPHPLTAADRAELDARALARWRGERGLSFVRMTTPLWRGPRDRRPDDWADSF